jgi:hypothetical protein
MMVWVVIRTLYRMRFWRRVVKVELREVDEAQQSIQLGQAIEQMSGMCGGEESNMRE